MQTPAEKMPTVDITDLIVERILEKVYLTQQKTEMKLEKALHELDTKFERLDAKLEERLPMLATSDEVKILLSDHANECREERKKSSDRLLRPSVIPSMNKDRVKVAAGSSGIVGVVWAIVELLRNWPF